MPAQTLGAVGVVGTILDDAQVKYSNLAANMNRLSTNFFDCGTESGGVVIASQLAKQVYIYNFLAANAAETATKAAVSAIDARISVNLAMQMLAVNAADMARLTDSRGSLVATGVLTSAALARLLNIPAVRTNVSAVIAIATHPSVITDIEETLLLAINDCQQYLKVSQLEAIRDNLKKLDVCAITRLCLTEMIRHWVFVTDEKVNAAAIAAVRSRPEMEDVLLAAANQADPINAVLDAIERAFPLAYTGIVGRVASSEKKATLLLTEALATELGIDLKQVLHDYNQVTKNLIANILADEAMKVSHIIDIAGVNMSAILNDDGYTPLHLAAYLGQAAIVEALTASAANRAAIINAQDVNGNTALMLAASRGHLAVVESLAARGAELDHHNDAGYIAQDLARAAGHMEVVELLVRLSAQAARASGTGLVAARAAAAIVTSAPAPAPAPVPTSAPAPDVTVEADRQRALPS